MKRVVTAVASLLMVVGVTVACGAGTTSGAAGGIAPVAYSRHGAAGFGYAVHPSQDLSTVLSLVKRGASTTVRTDLRWSQVEATHGRFDWSASDQYLTNAVRNAQHVLFVVDTTPSWASGKSTSVPNWSNYPPVQFAYYGAFIRQVLLRYGRGGSFWTANQGRLPYISLSGLEIWNEPNLPAYWPSGPNPTAYTSMVKAAYRGAKSVDSTTPIVVGALARHGAYNDSYCHNTYDAGKNKTGINPVNFLQSMYGKGLHGYFDAISIHPFTSKQGATATQMVAYNRCSVWSQMSQTKVSLRSLMIKYRDGAKKVWITEAGAPTCVAGHTYGCVTDTEQGRLATKEVALWKSYSWAGGYYWYEIRDQAPTPGQNPARDGEKHFGALRANNAKKPAYLALYSAFRK